MMRRIVTFIFMIVLFLSSEASQVKDGIITVSQPDGTVIDLYPCGDEHCHFFKTMDGLPVVKNENDGGYYYADRWGMEMTASDCLAHSILLRSSTEKSYISTMGSCDFMTYYAKSMRVTSYPKRSASLGEKKGIIILVNFSDNAFSEVNPKASFDSLANMRNFSGNGNFGSVRDYFLAQSYGNFDLTFDIVGPVTLHNNLAYYGGNKTNGDDIRPGEMIVAACKAVDDSVDFSKYDWDGDGNVDQVYVVYAGYGEQNWASSSTIWAHKWTLQESDYNNTLSADGVVINDYACSNELAGVSGKQMAGVGTLCHEFSHCLGLPDFYDTNYNYFGMNSWDIMSNGDRNGGGYCPAGYSSYEKWFCGWLEPKVLDATCEVTDMKALGDGGGSYVIYNDNDKNEYYMIENRQKVNWDSKLGGSGMLILHVNYSSSAWDDNTVNNSAQQGMSIFHADNSASTTVLSIAGDTYPYNGNDSLTDNSTPAAVLYNAGTSNKYLMGKPVTGIKQNSDGTISFKFTFVADDIKNSLVDNTDKFKGKVVLVYDTSGKLVKRTDKFDGLEPLNLPSGVYILKNGHGEVMKVTF